MSLEVGEVVEPAPEPVPKSRAKIKAKPKASSCVLPSWEERLSRASNLGIIAKHKLSNTSVELVPVESVPLKSRYWVVVRGSQCAHVGFTDRFAVAKQHISESEQSEPVPLAPICESFSSLAEVREFWNQVYPDTSLEHLQSTCNPVEYLSTQ